MVEQMSQEWPKLKTMLNTTQSIPQVTVDFLTNQTEQKKLIHFVENFLYYLPKS